MKGQEWMIRPIDIESMALGALEAYEFFDDGPEEDIYPMRQEATVDENGIATVSVKGGLMQEAPAKLERRGLVTRYSTIISDIEQVREQGARAIAFQVDSPGGTVAGNKETARIIANLPKQGIPTASAVNGLACSAAYKISSGTEVIFATESSEVGNIGTIMTWADCDEFWREQGVEFKALTNQGADLKSTFHLEPNSTQLAFLQERIDSAGDEFRQFVVEGRKNSEVELDPEVFRAGWYSGQSALNLGLIDSVGTLEDAKTFLLEGVV